MSSAKGCCFQIQISAGSNTVDRNCFFCKLQRFLQNNGQIDISFLFFIKKEWYSFLLNL